MIARRGVRGDATSPRGEPTFGRAEIKSASAILAPWGVGKVRVTVPRRVFSVRKSGVMQAGNEAY